METTQTNALKRKIDRLAESIRRVDTSLFTSEGVTDGALLCLEIDAERLTDYIRFLRKSRSI